MSIARGDELLTRTAGWPEGILEHSPDFEDLVPSVRQRGDDGLGFLFAERQLEHIDEELAAELIRRLDQLPPPVTASAELLDLASRSATAGS